MLDSYSFTELKFNPLFSALAEGTELARKFYPEISALPEAVRQTASRVTQFYNQDENRRKKIFDILSEIHPYKNEQSVQNSLELVLDKRTVLVVSGQQPCVLGGPLFSLVKALSTITLARKLNDQVKDFRFVPLFWVSGMDHDFEEVRDFYFIESSGKLRTFSLNRPPNTEGFPLSRVMLDKDSELRVKEVVQNMGKISEVNTSILESYKSGESITSAFIKLYAQILGKFGLLFIDPENDKAKDLASPLISESIETWEKQYECVKESTDKIQKLAIPPQIYLKENETNLFLLDEKGRRRKLVYSGNHFALKPFKDGDDNPTFSKDEILNLAKNEPGRFSFNVLLRPLYQQYVFPVVIYVGGPSEVAYWAQLYPLFDISNLPRPLLVPRPSVTLIPSRLKRISDKFKVSLTDLLIPNHELIRRIFEKEIPDGIEEGMLELRNTFLDRASKLGKKAKLVDQNLESVFRTLTKGFDSYLSKMKKKVVKAIRNKNEKIVEQVDSLYEFLMPNGQLQERVISGTYFLNRYGDQLIEMLIASFEFPPNKHKVLEVCG